MARFNKKNQGSITENLAGGVAYKANIETEISLILLTSLLQYQYYRKADNTSARLVELINQSKDKLFIAKAAIYARKTFGMRSIIHVVGAEIGKLVKGETWTKKYFYNMVNRPDDILETLSYYLGKYGFPLPHAMIKGFAQKLSEFNEYHLSKYSAKTKDLSMVDAVNLLHPKNSPALKKLMTGKLESAETWNTKLVRAGQVAESEDELSEMKAEAWKGLLENKKLGYMALLKNLRNISEQAPEVLDLALEQLVNKEVIKKSLVFPFRYYRAVKEFQNKDGARKIVSALSNALDLSLENCPSFDGKTLIVLDESSSMTSGKCSTLSCAEVGAIFASILYKKNDADMLLFADDSRFITADPNNSTLGLACGITFEGGSTNFCSIFNKLKVKYDRIFILSDMQGQGRFDHEFADYKKRTKANPKIYSIDLAGYGTLAFPEKNITCLGGFSDKIFDLIKSVEDSGSLVTEIKKITI